MWRWFGLPVSIAQHLVVVVTAAAATVFVVDVLHDCMRVFVMLHFDGYVDDNLLVAAAMSTRCYQGSQLRDANQC